MPKIVSILNESLMTGSELKLRDEINVALEKEGFHLRIKVMRVITDNPIFNFVPPVDRWFDELEAADSFVTQLILRKLQS